MKQYAVLLFVLVAALALAEAARVRRDEKYTTKYDNFNVDDVLASDRLLENYHKCLIDTGKCTPEGNVLKSHIKDALQTDCSKCSDKQKEVAEKVIKFLYNEKPELWKSLQEKYDEDDTYTKKYADRLKKLTD